MIVSEPPRFAYQLRLQLFIARDIPPTDDTSGSDVFTTLRCCGQVANSTVRYRTLNPNWFETLTLDVNFENLEEKGGVPAGFSLIVYDEDDDDKSELIGRVWVNIKAEKVTYIHPKTKQKCKCIYYRKPKWYNIMYDATGEVSG
jgi:hypothetical protein